jgi:hypothetical protein
MAQCPQHGLQSPSRAYCSFQLARATPSRLTRPPAQALPKQRVLTASPATPATLRPSSRPAANTATPSTTSRASGRCLIRRASTPGRTRFCVKFGRALSPRRTLATRSRWRSARRWKVGWCAGHLTTEKPRSARGRVLGELSLQAPAVKPEAPRSLRDVAGHAHQYLVDVLPLCTR